MANQTKAEAAAALQKAGIQRKSFSISEICARNGFSEGHYRALRRRGLGPREKRMGDRVIITADDEAEWLQAFKTDTAATTETT
jgi:hypothetical protein